MGYSPDCYSLLVSVYCNILSTYTMKNSSVKSWFTLVETVIVVIIVGVLLAMTMWLGGDYLRNTEYRYEREEFIWMMDKLIATVRTSNYWWSATYEYLEIELTTWWLSVFVDTWAIAIDSLALTKSSLVISGGSATIRLFPYNIACAEWTNYSEINEVIYVEDPITISFSQSADYTEQETCYQLDLRLCKLLQVPCSG